MILKTGSLTPQLKKIICDKATEYPFTGAFTDFEGAGTYICRQCGLPLFRSQTKFHSGCGWPSFDEEIEDAVSYQPDVDGMRTEIICARCKAHLGHVFRGENFTSKNLRHCVNSASLEYVSDMEVADTEEAIFAGGCFWGTEALFKKLPGVLKTEVGYTGGIKENPSYEEVCTGTTGHVEALRVVYDLNKIDFETLTKYFLEIHDSTQINGQGPDIGTQYLSVIFYYDEKQKKIAADLLAQLQQKGIKAATQLSPIKIFWPAEEYHQNYYTKTGKQPYCHFYVKRF